MGKEGCIEIMSAGNRESEETERGLMTEKGGAGRNGMREEEMLG